MSLTEPERKVLQRLVQKGGTGNVLDVLSFNDFDEAFAFANALQNKDLVKLLYSNISKNLIVVELTLPGFQAGKIDL